MSLAQVQQIVRQLYAAADRDWQELVEANERRPAEIGEPPIKVACGEGCAACCTYIVASDDIEAIYIAALVNDLPEPARTQRIDRLYAWTEHYERFQRVNRDPDAATWQGTYEGFEREYHRNISRWQIQRLACPMLDIDTHRCSIYADRPASCRVHHATYPPPDVKLTDPPDGCFTQPHSVRTGKPAVIWQLTDDLQDRVGERVMNVHKALKRPVRLGALGLLVTMAGEQNFGWQRGPGADAPVPVIERSFPDATSRD